MKSDEELLKIMPSIYRVQGHITDIWTNGYRLAESESQQEIERLKAELETAETFRHKYFELQDQFVPALEADLQSEKDKRVKMVGEIKSFKTVDDVLKFIKKYGE